MSVCIAGLGRVYQGRLCTCTMSHLRTATQYMSALCLSSSFLPLSRSFLPSPPHPLPSLLCVLQIIFLSTLFYLLNASKEQFLLVEMATKLIPRQLQLRQQSRDGQQQHAFVQVRLVLHIVLSCPVMSCHVHHVVVVSCHVMSMLQLFHAML